MALHADLKEFVELLNSHGVEYIIVGAYTLAFHGRPRYTGDIDIFVRVSDENAAKLVGVIRDFGFGETGLDKTDFLKADQIVQLGVAPNRIDILTGLTGVSFDDAWANRIEATLDGLTVFFLSKDLLISNKL